MKIERKNEKILSNMSIDSFISAKELAIKLHSTEKTIRSHIYSLNDFLKKNGAYIQIKYGSGYRLIIEDERLFSKIYKNQRITDIQENPITPEERADYIVCFLLMQNNYVDLLQLCEILNISEATLMLDIRNAREIISSFQLRLISKRKEGMKIVGEEFDIRLCMANYLEISKMLDMNCRKQIDQEKRMISKVVLSIFNRYHATMPEVSLEKFISHIYISIRRIQDGYKVNAVLDEISQIDDEEIKKMTIELCRELSLMFDITFCEDEMNHILIYMISQRLNKSKCSYNNVLLSTQTLDLVNRILDFINQTMNLNLHNNFSLLMDLNVHMIPLIIRLNYHIHVENPLLYEIKQNYPLSYTIALQAGIVIEKEYNEKISEDEIGYLALIFEVSMKKAKKKRKKNIVIVCATGKSSAELLAYQYRKMFHEYLDEIHVCNVHELKEMDYANVDYVFTTTPIHLTIPVPIFKTKFTLSHDDYLNIHKEFELENANWLKLYYREELFFDHVQVNSKAEVLQFMVNEISKVENLPQDFYESIIQREEIGTTDFGDVIALPHPYGRVTEHTFASVCILNKPVFWGGHEVSIVILLSICDDNRDDLDKFYTVTSEFMLSHTKAKSFLKHPSYEAFINSLLMV